MIETLLATILALQINLYRIENGLEYIPIESSVCEYTEMRLDQIKNDWSHAGFKQSFRDKTAPEGFIRENLARNYNNTSLVLEGWKQSEKHNEMLLSQFYDEMCVRTDGNYWVFHGYDKKD